jgi:hypothetical protein
MLNERAAVAGKLCKFVARQRSLASRIAAAQEELAVMASNLQTASSGLNAAQATLDALDASIALMYQAVRPDAAGVVNAWAGKYGCRGGLQDFVIKTLRDASPAPISSRDLRTRAIGHFGIAITCTLDRISLQASLRTALHQAFGKGLIEPMHNQEKAGVPGLWRWKQPATLGDLAARAAAMP